MGLQFNGTDQALSASVNITAPQPYTMMCWIQAPTGISGTRVPIQIGDSTQDLNYISAQWQDSRTRAISFNPFTEARGETSEYLLNTGTTRFLACVFDGSSITLYVDDATPISSAWSPSGSVTYDLISISRSVRASEYNNATLEHVAVWNGVLSAANISALYNLTSAPDDFANLISWLPFKDSLTDSVGGLTWTPENLGTPSYVDLGIEYGVTQFTVTYDGNGADSGTAPVDGSSPYDSGSTVTVLGNTGNLARANFTFDGWNTQANGLGTSYDPSDTFTISANTTLYANWVAQFQYRTIDEKNFDPASYSNAQIDAAKLKKVYYEHASTGQDIVGNSDDDSSTGQNYDSTGLCGLALLYAENNRYLCSRESFTSSNDPTWFDTNTGLQDNNRGNPTPATKVSGFVGMSSAMRAAVEIAMWKYCWIDVWPSTGGYISDGNAAAASDISDIEAFETANPNITVVWWTMPLQSNESYQARQDYNDVIRNYCLENGKWLFDIAAIESHNDLGEIQLDGNNREIAESSYMRADGGHLGTTGRIKMGRAYWSLLAAITADEGVASYLVDGVTYNSSGQIEGSCEVSLFKHAGSGVYSYVTTGTSDAVTGAYSLEATDSDSSYMVVAHKDGTPNTFDVSDNNLKPELNT